MKGESFHVRFWSKVDRTPGRGPHGDCWMWTGVRVTGYGQTTKPGKVRAYAHRASYEFANNVILADVRDGGPLVCHTCDERACVNPAHLFLGSNTDNMQDMIRKGRQVIRDNRGEANPRSKLQPNEVLAIRRDTRPGQDVADDYNIGPASVSQIRNLKSWRHLQQKEVTQ